MTGAVGWYSWHGQHFWLQNRRKRLDTNIEAQVAHFPTCNLQYGVAALCAKAHAREQ